MELHEGIGQGDESRGMISKILDSGVALRGEIEFILRDRSGRVKDYRKIANLIVNAGKAEVAGLINEATSGGFKYIAIGTGTTAPAATDTELETEITTGGGARALATTLDRVTTTVTNDTARMVVTFNFTSAFAVTESGLFDAAGPPPAGNMLARRTFAAINVDNGDSLQITWKVQVS